MSLDNRSTIGPSIQRVGGSAGPGAYRGNLTAATQAGYSPVKDFVANESPLPKQGGVGSQSLPPRGVQSGFGATAPLPPGGFQNTGSFGGSQVPQNGGGEVAKSAQNTPQKHTGTATNPYGKTTAPGQSPNDAFTNALLEKVLNDRKKGEGAVKRDKEGKVESIETAKLDEKSKEEINKLSEVFKQSAKELDKSIETFKASFKEQLKGSDEDKNLDGILDKVTKAANDGSMDPKSEKYNPQKFMDAAKELGDWITKNPEKAKAYGDNGQALKDINDKVQGMSLNAQGQIALAENNPQTVLKAAELSAKNSETEAGKLKEKLETGSQGLTTEADKKIVTDFQAQLDKTMATLKPGTGPFDIDASNKSLSALKQSFNKLPDAVKNDKEIAKSYKKVEDLATISVKGQTLARTEEPKSAEYQRRASEYIKGANGLDASLKEHSTPKEREVDLKAVTGNQTRGDSEAHILDESTDSKAKEIAETQSTSPEPGIRGDLDPSNLFPQDDTEPTTNPETTSKEVSLDTKLDLENLTQDSSLDNAIDNATEDIEVPDPVEDLQLEDLDLNLDIE